MTDSYDVVIVGGGIGGGALATALARGGMSVLVLEKSLEYRDRVRGEWIAPWGVVEAQQVGVYDLLVEAGGHSLKRHVSYGDDVDDPAAAEQRALDMSSLLPGVPGPLCLRHTVACQALTDAAEQAGATVLRGVEGVQVHPGGSPSVRYVHDGAEHEARCRIIVGADGRTGVTRQQSGIELHADPQHHLFSGLLVEDAHGWPDDVQTKGTAGDVNFLAFPQGGGRVRLYLGYDSARKGFLSGDGATKRFLEAFRLPCLPDPDVFANATPVSRCYSYPNNDTWTEVPFVEGLVLLGDAAGHNDPIIGQGLSITLRDVRMVADVLLGSDDWSPSAFAGYAEERRERMRRLRFAGSLQATIDSEFGPEALGRRKRISEAADKDPTLRMWAMAVMVGPEKLPPFAFDEALRERILAI